MIAWDQEKKGERRGREGGLALVVTWAGGDKQMEERPFLPVMSRHLVASSPREEVKLFVSWRFASRLPLTAGVSKPSPKTYCIYILRP